MGRGKGLLHDMASSKISDGVLLKQLPSQCLGNKAETPLARYVVSEPLLFLPFWVSSVTSFCHSFLVEPLMRSLPVPPTFPRFKWQQHGVGLETRRTPNKELFQNHTPRAKVTVGHLFSETSYLYIPSTLNRWGYMYCVLAQHYYNRLTLTY